MYTTAPFPLPEVWPGGMSFDRRRKEILALLSEFIYGFKPECGTADGIIRQSNERCCAGRVTHTGVEIGFDAPGERFAFPLQVFIPKNADGPLPMLLYISFSPETPNKYYPIEEICDNGYATAMFCYKDITADDGDFSDGLAGLLYGPDAVRTGADTGKIGIWALAVSKALDYLLKLETIDPARIAVVGHSRLGKTALWAAAQDERFCAGISNNSGCSGAALTRGMLDSGETIAAINHHFPYWFCPNYKRFAGKESSLPVDQHFLLAAIAPRKVYVASAAEDLWASPQNEYRACAAALPVWERLGFDESDFKRVTELTVPFSTRGRHIGYHLRPGCHYLSRHDWQKFMDFLK